jgi:hypothetical protein
MFWRQQNPLDAPAAVGSLGSGLAGGVLAGFVLCPPVLAVLLGLGGSTLFGLLGMHQTALRVAAGLLLTLIVAWWSTWRRSGAGDHDLLFPSLLVAVGAFIAVYATINEIALPHLHDLYHVFVPHE